MSCFGDAVGGFRSLPRPFCLSVLPAEPSCSSFCRTCLAVSLPRVTREPHAARDAAQRVGAEAAASPCACSRCLKPCSWHARGAVGRSWRRISARRPRGGGRQHLGRGASGGRQATSGRTSAGGPVSSTPWMPSLLAKPPPLSLFFPLQPLVLVPAVAQTRGGRGRPAKIVLADVVGGQCGQTCARSPAHPPSQLLVHVRSGATPAPLTRLFCHRDTTGGQIRRPRPYQPAPYVLPGRQWRRRGAVLGQHLHCAPVGSASHATAHGAVGSICVTVAAADGLGGGYRQRKCARLGEEVLPDGAQHGGAVQVQYRHRDQHIYSLPPLATVLTSSKSNPNHVLVRLAEGASRRKPRQTDPHGLPELHRNAGDLRGGSMPVDLHNKAAQRSRTPRRGPCLCA